MASDCRRVTPRARSRPLTLMHAISSTSAVAQVSARSAGRYSRASSSRSGTTARVRVPGKSTLASAPACVGDTPARSRAIAAWNEKNPVESFSGDGRRGGRITNGFQNSSASVGK